MSTKKCRWLLLGFLFVIVIGWATGQYDYERLVAGKRPVFARFQVHLMDGGSVQYWGLGYTVTARHEMRWGIEVQPETRGTTKAAPFRVGPTLDYWTPFISREQTRFIMETNQ
jgi:hypothetical protein